MDWNLIVGESHSGIDPNRTALRNGESTETRNNQFGDLISF